MGGRSRFIHADFLEWATPALPTGDGFDLVIGNPPFGLHVEGRKLPKPIALEHIQAGLRCLLPGGHLVFLLRQSFAASRERYEKLFKRHRPERVWNLVQRPSFTEDGQTDMHEYACFVFGAESAQQTLTDWMDWAP
jgi:23S rRNA G2069 N7-methylase RlmK/C1962 C5-methylase RlmI